MYTLATAVHMPDPSYPSCAFHTFDPGLTGIGYASDNKPPHAANKLHHHCTLHNHAHTCPLATHPKHTHQQGLHKWNAC